MDIDQVIRALLAVLNSVWVYQTANSYGKELVQLLDVQGNELAWRWLSDAAHHGRLPLQ
jgi:phosphoribosylformimino-5-aminoimidazole carboxamide ribonucleotide (ProFAR) isomerase